MELMNIINDAGVPPGVVNLLSGDPEKISNQLILSDIIKKVSITGSTRVGKLILKKAADKVQRVTMELSGHAPFIVFEDSNIDKVTDMAIASKYRNNGQVCISPSRFYIHESKKEEFTKNFISDEEFALMKNSVIIANTARGGIINENALLNALKNKKILGASLDVFEKEPPDSNHPIFKLSNVLLSPHNAALTLECRKRMAIESAENVIYFLSNQEKLNINNIVNKEKFKF